MHKYLKYGLVVALLVAAGAIYFLSERSRAVPNQPGKCTTIRFEQDTLRLGQVALGATVPFVFKYTNTGDVPAGALYRLHNRTKRGEDGQERFW